MRQKRLWAVLFGLYCALMLWLLFDRSGYDPAVPYADQLKWNLIPFETIALFARLLDSANPEFRKFAVINLFGNVIMFIPLGFLLPKVFHRQNRLWKVLLTTALLIIGVELAQLLTLLGSFDTDDLILNVLGAAIGYGFYKLYDKGAA